MRGRQAPERPPDGCAWCTTRRAEPTVRIPRGTEISIQHPTATSGVEDFTRSAWLPSGGFRSTRIHEAHKDYDAYQCDGANTRPDEKYSASTGVIKD